MEGLPVCWRYHIARSTADRINQTSERTEMSYTLVALSREAKAPDSDEQSQKSRLDSIPTIQFQAPAYK